MIKITIGIKGVTPLLMNKFTDEAAMIASGGSRTSAAAADRGTEREIAETKIYRDAEGNHCIPTPNLMRCFVDGGVFHKTGKSQVTTKEKSLLYACVDVLDVTARLVVKEPWSVDVRAIVNPSTKGRILSYRPRFDQWALEVEVELDETILNPKLFRMIVDDAGKRVGLGDFRPARKGPFGKFVVIKWVEKVLKLPKLEVEVREAA